MLERIEEIRQEAGAAIEAAGGTAELEELRVRYLGRKAELTTILRGIAELPGEERGKVGAAANQARQALEQLLATRAEVLDATELEQKLSGSSRFSAQGRVDISDKGTAAVSFNVSGNTKLPQPRRVRVHH